MSKRRVLNLLGKVLLLLAAALLVPMGVALYYGQGDAMAFLKSALIAAAVALPLSMLRPTNANLLPKEGFVTVALCWIALSLFGALPAYLGGYIPRFVDSLFETVSGFTTTGATILTDVEALPRGILLWRSLTLWLGGMGVLVLSLALIPNMGARSLNLLKAESPGPTPGKLVPRIRATAMILYRIYLGMTALMIAVMLLLGMRPYDAVIHTLGAAGTGGFSNYNNSIAHFNSPQIEFWTATFLLMFGLNFSLYFLLIGRQFRAAFQNEEARAFLCIVLVSVGLVAFNLLGQYGSFAEALRHGYFQVCSTISTTAFSSVDYSKWPQLSRMVLVVLMIIGGCAGSTGGGLKVSRVLLLVKSGWRDIRRMAKPRGVYAVKLSDRAVDETVLSQVQAFAFLYLLLIFLGALTLSLDNMDFESTITAAVAAVGNIGPGLGALVGPTGNYAALSPASKLMLAFCMLCGRLEIYPMLMLLSRGVWQKN